MAHRLGSYDFSRGGATSKYPWDEWLDGRIWRLIGGRDFQVPANNFRRHVCTTAKRRGLRVQTHVQDGDVILQALPLDPEAPSARREAAGRAMTADPRVEAVVRIVARTIHADPAVAGGAPNPSDCKGCRELAVAILAAADAADPLRDKDRAARASC